LVYEQEMYKDNVHNEALHHRYITQILTTALTEISYKFHIKFTMDETFRNCQGMYQITQN